MRYLVLDRNKKPTGRVIEDKGIVDFIKTWVPADKLDKPVDPKRLGNVTAAQLSEKIQNKVLKLDPKDKSALMTVNQGLYVWYGFILVPTVMAATPANMPKPHPRPDSRGFGGPRSYNNSRPYGKGGYKPGGKDGHKKPGKPMKPAKRINQADWPADKPRKMKIYHGNIIGFLTEVGLIPIGIYEEVEKKDDGTYDIKTGRFDNDFKDIGLELQDTTGDEHYTQEAIREEASKLDAPETDEEKLKLAYEMRDAFDKALKNRQERHWTSILEYGAGMIDTPNDDPVNWTKRNEKKIDEARRKFDFYVYPRRLKELDKEFKELDEKWSHVPEIRSILHCRMPRVWRYYDVARIRTRRYIMAVQAMNRACIALGYDKKQIDQHLDEVSPAAIKEMAERKPGFVMPEFDTVKELRKTRDRYGLQYGFLHTLNTFITVSHDWEMRTRFSNGSPSISRILGTNGTVPGTLRLEQRPCYDEIEEFTTSKLKMMYINLFYNVVNRLRNKYSKMPEYHKEFSFYHKLWMQDHPSKAMLNRKSTNRGNHKGGGKPDRKPYNKSWNGKPSNPRPYLGPRPTGYDGNAQRNQNADRPAYPPKPSSDNGQSPLFSDKG